MFARLLAAALTLICANPALAQKGPAPLQIPADKPFLHANSGITLPVALAGLSRVTANEYVTPQLDVLFTYKDAPVSEELSVYIYRATAGTPAIWFNEAAESIGNRPAFRRLTDIDLPPTFTPPGQTVTSGMKAAWTVSDSPVRSTALVIVPMGEWLVKFRYSSTVREAASLLRQLDAAIAALGWPAAMPAEPAAALIADCTTPLKFKGASKPAKTDGAIAFLDAIASAADGDRKSEERTERATWCRDRAAEATLPIYRPVGTDDSYLAALSDSGHAIWVRPSLSGLIAKDRKPSWSVSIVLPGETTNYPGRDRLPPPAQLDGIIKGSASSRVATWGEKRNVTIDSRQIK